MSSPSVKHVGSSLTPGKNRILHGLSYQNFFSNISPRKMTFVKTGKPIIGVTHELYKGIMYTSYGLSVEERLDMLKTWDDFVFRRGGLQECLEKIEEICVLEEILIKKQIEHEQKQKEKSPKVKRPIAKPRRKRPAAPLVGKPIAEEIRQYLNSTESCSVILGPNGTTVTKTGLRGINWNYPGPYIARKVIMEVFDRNTLATHTLSGKPSPAFMGCNKPSKEQLNMQKVQDIIYFLTTRVGLNEKEIRQSITTKCADENKMLRLRMEKLEAEKINNNKKIKLDDSKAQPQIPPNPEI